MTNPLDMSLDDLISSSKKSAARGRGVRGSDWGPSRRFPNRATTRAAPYLKPVQAPDTMWQHDLLKGDAAAYTGQAGRASSIETGTKLYISNLDYGVSSEDIKELFLEVGDLKRYSVHYDRSGRSKGTAEVVFSSRVDAVAAFNRYNNVQLDGKPLRIEIVGTNIATPTVLPPAMNGMYGIHHGAARRGLGRGAVVGQPHRGGRGASRGRGRSKGRGEKISAEDLDAELDKYHQEAMETN